MGGALCPLSLCNEFSQKKKKKKKLCPKIYLWNVFFLCVCVCACVYDFLICKMRSFSKNSWYEIAKIYFIIAQKQNLFTFPTKEKALCTGYDLLFFNCNLTWALCIMLWIWRHQLFCFCFFSSREVILDICIGFVHHLFDSLPSCIFFDLIGFVCCTYYIFY